MQLEKMKERVEQLFGALNEAIDTFIENGIKKPELPEIDREWLEGIRKALDVKAEVLHERVKLLNDATDEIGSQLDEAEALLSDVEDLVDHIDEYLGEE